MYVIVTYIIIPAIYREDDMQRSLVAIHVLRACWDQTLLYECI
jgi:hypothetical protein